VFSWRITKYNPKNRDFNGVYLIKNEWTSYSEIGNVLDEKIFTYKEYFKIENAYVSAIILFMECNNLESLKVTALGKSFALNNKDNYLSEKMKRAFNGIKEGLNIDKSSIDSIARLVLREELWCKFESKDMFVHFGWDYYMYIGSFNKCEKYIQKIRENGLFVEEYESPYLD
jgi:hypothetical protein